MIHSRRTRSCRVTPEAGLQRGLLDIHRQRHGSVRVEPQVLRTFEGTRISSSFISLWKNARKISQFIYPASSKRVATGSLSRWSLCKSKACESSSSTWSRPYRIVRWDEPEEMLAVYVRLTVSYKSHTFVTVANSSYWKAARRLFASTKTSVQFGCSRSYLQEQ